MSETLPAPRTLAEKQGLPPDSLISQLMERQTVRRHCIQTQSKLDRAIESFLARTMGYDTQLTPVKRKQLFAAAKKARQMVEKPMKEGQDPYSIDLPIPPAVVDFIALSYKSRNHWDAHRDMIEKQMAAMARRLPVWPWVKTVKGVAELGLAVIIGEAGDLGAYSGPAKLWKRLGLACIDGHRQGFVPKEITGDARSEEWERRGYNPRRRAEVWAFLDDVLFRAQWRGEKRDADDNVIQEAHAIGPYGEIYGERKAWNVLRGLPPAHADRDARRFMAKRFILHLWVEWQRATAVPLLADAAE